MSAILSLVSFFTSPLGRWIGAGAIVAVLLGGTYIKGDLHGAARVQAKWDSAIAADVQRGNDARAAAEREIPAVGDVAPPAPTGVQRLNPFARRVPDDRYDRDRTAGAVQPVARNHVLRQPGHPGNRPANPRPQPNRPQVGVLGVVQPSGTYPCWQVKLGLATLTQKKIDELAQKATPEQRAAAQKCLEKRGK